MTADKTIKVAVLMGSKSDWDVMKSAVETLQELGVPHDVRVLSAHRTHDALVEYVQRMEAAGVEVFIAGAGGAAHLAGVVAGVTTKPVLGTPMKSSLDGLDSLLSTVQMPAGIPVATFAIGKAGCVNAALFAAAILGVAEPKYDEKIKRYRAAKAEKILAEPDPRVG
ncbi:MAG TPA: 5-(carboxyamino)imidazole ribonucleotide mutase [candidate division Zixibacteria bacterium]|nr:5-(carboxyamino)imidazole ribonucleotide mutase [candidate division Zixibacteria bacterium]